MLTNLTKSRAAGAMWTAVAALAVALSVAGCKDDARITLGELIELEREAAQQPSVAPASGEDEAFVIDLRSYRAKPGDVLLIEIKGLSEERYASDLFTNRIHRDGTIKMPVVGDIHVADMELAEIERVINQAHLDAEVATEDLAVFVQLAEEGPQSVYVTGLVNSLGPVAIPRNSRMTALRAIATAGGVTPLIDVKEATLIRALDNDDQHHVKLSIGEMLAGREPDLVLKPGDILHVPNTPDTIAQQWFWDNVLVGPFQVGVRYDPLQAYNTNRALQTDDGGAVDDVRSGIRSALPALLVPPVAP